MNELITQSQTISSLEIAEMLEVSHRDVMRKIDGSTDRKGYIEILGEAQMGVTDYFIKSTYLTDQNKELSCYLITKMGCEFLANKFTGEKGVIFSAKYVKRFNEMEQHIQNPSLTYSNLSPQLQFMINIENEQKAIKSEMSSLKTRVAEIECTKTVDPEASWKHEINSKIESIAKDRRLSPLKFRTTLYQELETQANVLLGVRQKYLAKRMKSAGHKHREYANVAKIDVIYQNKELRAEFEEIINDMMNV